MRLPSAKVGLALGLLGLGLAYAVLLAPRRSAEFAGAVPVLPPDLRVVLLARSDDGQGWTLDTAVVARPGDTPDLLARPDGVLLYYLDGAADRLMVRRLPDGEPQVLDLGETCAAEAGHACVDPAALATPDGGVRLFFAQGPRGVDPAVHGGTRIRSARSDDGLHFVVDAEPVLPETGRVDPDPVRLPDGRIRLYTTRLVDLPGQRDPVVRVESAVGGDEGSFTLEPGVRVADASATRTVALAGGGFRTWFHDERGLLRVAESDDGLSFSVLPGALLGPDVPGTRYYGIEAPGVAQAAGGWLMAVSTAREPWWPVNVRVAREAVREAREGAP